MEEEREKECQTHSKDRGIQRQRGKQGLREEMTMAHAGVGKAGKAEHRDGKREARPAGQRLIKMRIQ